MSIVDRPQTEIKDDTLDRAPIVATICSALARSEEGIWKSTEAVIGLTGEWGSGESTILNYVEESLSNRIGVQVIRFNPWIITGHGGQIDVYFREMAHQLGRSKFEKARELAQQLDRYREGIAAAAEFVFPSAGFFGKIPIVKEETLAVKRARLEAKLADFEGGIVVIIDELDRVEDDDIRELARFVKAIGDLPNVSYLIGYDHVRVQDALSRGRGAKDGEEYLKKIVQVNIPVRPMMDYEVETILNDLLDPGLKTELESHGDEWQTAKRKISNLIETPRELKRFIATAASYWAGAKREVHPIDLVLFSALASASSDLRSFLVSNLNSLIDDPWDLSATMKRVLAEDQSKNFFDHIDFDTDRFGQFKEVIESLFPTIKDQKNSEDFGRISRFENFMCLLYFGDPPFRLSRKEVEEFWSNPTLEFFEALDAQKKSQSLPKRFERLANSLPQEKDDAAFRVISQFCSKQADATGDRRSEIAKEIRWSLVRLADQEPTLRGRLRKVVEGLQSSDDYAILPDMVRHHMFAFGLADGFLKRDYPTVLDEADFVKFLSIEIERYRNQLLTGGWLDSFVDAQPFYAVLQSRAYTPKIVDELSIKIVDPSAAFTFCRLLAPSGHTIEREILREFVDTDALLKGIEQISGSLADHSSVLRVRELIVHSDA